MHCYQIILVIFNYTGYFSKTLKALKTYFYLDFYVFFLPSYKSLLFLLRDFCLCCFHGALLSVLEWAAHCLKKVMSLLYANNRLATFESEYGDSCGCCFLILPGHCLSNLIKSHPHTPDEAGCLRVWMLNSL